MTDPAAVIPGCVMVPGSGAAGGAAGGAGLVLALSPVGRTRDLPRAYQPAGITPDA